MTVSVAPTPVDVTAARRHVGVTTYVCLAVLGTALTAAILGPWLAPHTLGQTVGPPFTNTAADGMFGTDRLGRDVWSQILHVGRRIVLVPLVAAALATATGAAVGMLLASSPRRRPLDVVLSVVIVIPSILVLLLMSYRFGEGAWVVVAIVVIVNLPYAARYTRAAARRAWDSPFVEHARLRGESASWIAANEVLPIVTGPVLSDAGLRFVGSVYLITAASFLGFGPSPPATDWASMIGDNVDGASLNGWAVAAPALMIALLTVSANLLADRLAARIER